MKNAIQWFTETTYVDLDTGEVLTKDRFKSEGYTIIKKSKKSQVYETTGIVRITNECRRLQGRLFT